ncbi:methyltransferase sun-like protein [Sarcoptes scabiei]|uniref:NOL1/NOP2/Sun domain family member 4 n=1 Tax=Sarcoptes scabiei TaxID=52283 RepID=A0A132AJJ5_SARSC|nr:methyltransferase sun-like protein [Sarcoptes scabiei]
MNLMNCKTFPTSLFSNFTQRRFLSFKYLYRDKKSKTLATDTALKHFDYYYEKCYGNHWPSIRLGLLSPKKYFAIVNNHVDFNSVEIELRQIGSHNLRFIYMKNLKKIVQRKTRDDFVRSRKSFLNSTREQNEDDEDQRVKGERKNRGLLIDSCYLDFVFLDLKLFESEASESESIEKFFTDHQNDDSDLESNNAASFDLDLNSFVPVTELKYREDVIEETKFDLYNLDQDEEFVVEFQEENILNIPELLNLYLFRSNDFTSFPKARLCENNLFNYYLVDGASTLPVLLLDIQDGDYVGDFCSAPGGKSLMMALTEKNCRLLLNDLSESRLRRLKNVFDSFIPKSNQSLIEFKNQDCCTLRRYDQFDKILVDVPCTNDRHSLFNNENNLFHPQRFEERLRLPMRQMKILIEAMKSVRVGGTIVYSTCSLSPIQNDGVVHMAIKQLQNAPVEYGKTDGELSFKVVKTKEALRPLRSIFHMFNNSRYGVQILPNICNNYGPMYISKLVRVT